MQGPWRRRASRTHQSGKTKRLPLSQELAEWIASYVDPSDQLTREPLFVNPGIGERWGHWSLRDAWLRAARAIGLGGVKFCEAMATAAIARGVNERIPAANAGTRGPSLDPPLRAARRFGLGGGSSTAARNTGLGYFVASLSPSGNRSKRTFRNCLILKVLRRWVWRSQRESKLFDTDRCQ